MFFSDIVPLWLLKVPKHDSFWSNLWLDDGNGTICTFFTVAWYEISLLFLLWQDCIIIRVKKTGSLIYKPLISPVMHPLQNWNSFACIVCVFAVWRSFDFGCETLLKNWRKGGIFAGGQIQIRGTGKNGRNQWGRNAWHATANTLLNT